MASTNAGAAVAGTKTGNSILIWKDRRMGMVIAIGFAALSGILFAQILPRGPTAQTQGLLLLAGSLILGVLVGYVMQSRLAILLVPVVHVLALEIFRPQLLGSTVGVLRLNETYGILAFVLGRGLYGLVAIVPMMIGVYLGLVLAHQLSENPGSGFWRWIPSLLVSGIVMALAVWIALPASTPPILGADGKILTGSISELTSVRLGGLEQTIMIRGFSSDKPVLLYLNGGPGQSGLPFTRVVLNDLSRDFVIVDWDQRGTGKSYSAFEPSSSLTLGQAINDTLETPKKQVFTIANAAHSVAFEQFETFDNIMLKKILPATYLTK